MSHPEITVPGNVVPMDLGGVTGIDRVDSRIGIITDLVIPDEGVIHAIHIDPIDVMPNAVPDDAASITVGKDVDPILLIVMYGIVPYHHRARNHNADPVGLATGHGVPPDLAFVTVRLDGDPIDVGYARVPGHKGSG